MSTTTAAGPFAYTHARQALADAIVATPMAQGAFQSAQRILEAAQAQVDAARSSLAEFEGLDDAIASANLAALKGAAMERVQQLASRRRDRIVATEELAASEATLQLARAEMETSKVAADKQKHAIGNAIAAVLSEHVQTVRTELENLKRRRHDLLKFLSGLQLTPTGWEFMACEARDATVCRWIEQSGFPSGEAPTWSSLIVGVLATLRGEGFPTGNGPSTSAALWKDFAAALLQDPTAEAPPLP
jgi:hypothetical protein